MATYKILETSFQNYCCQVELEVKEIQGEYGKEVQAEELITFYSLINDTENLILSKEAIPKSILLILDYKMRIMLADYLEELDCVYYDGCPVISEYLKKQYKLSC